MDTINRVTDGRRSFICRHTADHAAQSPLSSSASSSKPLRRIILALCLGGIGDTVLAFAALRDLRRACPDDHITALTMWPQSADLLKDLGILDEVVQHNFQKDRYWRSLINTIQLRRQHYDVSILAFPSNRFEYNLLTRLIGAPQADHLEDAGQ